MSAVSLLRDLWSFRHLVAVAAIASVLIALVTAYRVDLPAGLESRQYDVGVASTSALIDTPTSQIIDLGGTSSTSSPALPGRAALLANLMTTPAFKKRVAESAGIDPATLLAVAPPPGELTAEASGTGAPAGGPPPDARATSKLTLTTDVTLPIISVAAESLDADRARRLANGTIAVLQAHLRTLAGAEGVPEKRRLVVTQLGSARQGVLVRGRSPLLGIGAGLLAFVLLCAAILAVMKLARSFVRPSHRRPAEDERHDADHRHDRTVVLLGDAVDGRRGSVVVGTDAPEADRARLRTPG